jgi:hypothetical protein
LFVQALAYGIAAELAIPITQDKALRPRWPPSARRQACFGPHGFGAGQWRRRLGQ